MPETTRPPLGPAGTHRLTINVPDEMFERLRRQSFDERRTMTEIVVDAIERARQIVTARPP